jgi:hypothetical protein
MTHPQVGPGTVRVDGTVEVFDGRNWRVMPPTFDPLAVAIRQFLATTPAPCACCGRYECECGAADDWREAMNPDPHGDLSSFADQEIPF